MTQQLSFKLCIYTKELFNIILYSCKNMLLKMNDFEHEESVHLTKRRSGNWRVGRRVVDLEVLAEGLQSCQQCNTPLHLHQTLNIITYGLSAILKVNSQNNI